MKTILVAEDDKNARFLLEENLIIAGYKVCLAENGEEGIVQFGLQKVDLCILDIMMPIKDGISLAKEIRKLDSNVPIVFLSARNMNNDKIDGFTAGCDDYVTKPYSIDELLLRLKAIFKRSAYASLPTSVSVVGSIRIDHVNRKIQTSKNNYKISFKESELLRVFCENLDNTIPRDFVLKEVWGKDDVFTANSMDVYLNKIRKYLKDDPNIIIQNIHGFGFKMTLI